MGFEIQRALQAQVENKAIPAHPALMARTPVSVYSPGANRSDAVISQREASRHLDAYGGGQAIDWVYDCIGLYADSVASAPYKLKRVTDGTTLVRLKTKGTPPDHEIGPKTLYDLLDKPNPFMLYDELMALLVIDLMLVGNAYWLKWRVNDDGHPLALYRLSPSYVRIVPGQFGPKRYEYQPPGARDPLKIPFEQIIHFRRPNPHNAYYGMGVVQGAGRSMDLELAITDTMASYYENRADPSLIIQSERRVPRDVFNKLRAQLRARVAGAPRAGELLVLESGLKASTLSPSAADALFKDLSKMSRDRIFTKFRASPLLFGLVDDAGSSNKISDARREFDNYTLRPFLDTLQNQITASLTEAWGVAYTINYRTQLPPEEAAKIAGEIAKVPGIKVREVRAQYAQFGIEESTGDPEIDEEILNLPTNELDENGQPIGGGPGKADRSLPGEAGRPPLGENTASFPSDGSIPAGARVRRGQKALSFGEAAAVIDALAEAEKKALEREGRTTVGNHLPDEQAPVDNFRDARTREIDDTSEFITAGLRGAAHDLERAMLDHVEGKALKTSDLIQRLRRSPAWNTFRDRITEVLEEGARRAASAGVIQSGLTPDEDVDYDSLVKSVVHRPEGVRSILKTLRERLVNRVKTARDKENAERIDLENAVREVVGEWTTGQAVGIAETEAVHAYNEATLTAAELAGVTDVYVTDGNDHDEPCIEANGSVWTIEFARENRLQHPRCRRAFLPLTQVT